MKRTFEHSNDDRAWILQKGREARQTGKPVYLETRQDEGQQEPFPRFLIWCPDCQDYSVALPQGRYGRLSCHGCGAVYGRMHPKPGVDTPNWRLIRVALLRTAILAAIIVFIVSVRRC